MLGDCCYSELSPNMREAMPKFMAEVPDGLEKSDVAHSPKKGAKAPFFAVLLLFVFGKHNAYDC